MESTQYITTRRARFTALCGPVNIPWGTAVEAVDNYLQMDGVTLCAVTGQNAHDYFARNDDGNGLERGRLTSSIIRRLAKRDRDHQKRWDRMWEDPLAGKYRRQDYADFWVWGHDFFEAPLEDLRYIAELVGVAER